MALATYCQATADWRRYQRLITKRNDASDDDLGGDIQTFKTGAQQMHVLRQLANAPKNDANAAGAQFGPVAYVPAQSENVASAAR